MYGLSHFITFVFAFTVVKFSVPGACFYRLHKWLPCRSPAVKKNGHTVFPFINDTTALNDAASGGALASKCIMVIILPFPPSLVFQRKKHAVGGVL